MDPSQCPPNSTSRRHVRRKDIKSGIKECRRNSSALELNGPLQNQEAHQIEDTRQKTLSDPVSHHPAGGDRMKKRRMNTLGSFMTCTEIRVATSGGINLSTSKRKKSMPATTMMDHSTRTSSKW